MIEPLFWRDSTSYDHTTRTRLIKRRSSYLPRLERLLLSILYPRKMVVNRTPRRTRVIPGAHAKPPHPSRWSRWFSLPGFGIFLAVIVALCLWLENMGVSLSFPSRIPLVRVLNP